MVAQGAHASLKAVLDEGFFQAQDYQARDPFVINMSDEMEAWVRGQFAKICVGVDSEEELLAIYQTAKYNNLHCSLIQDAGYTEFDGVPTYTACAVGPGLVDSINKITGELKLL